MPGSTLKVIFSFAAPVGLVWVDCRITVMVCYPGAALDLIKHMENIEVPETYSGEFEVELSREDTEGSWFFGDKELSSSSKYIISSRRGRHSLSVKDVKKGDQGKYTFVCGDLTTSASLKMKRKNFKAEKICGAFLSAFELFN